MQERVDFEKDWNLFEIDTAEKLMNHLAAQKPRDERQVSIMLDRALGFFKKFNPDKVIETNFGSAMNQFYRFQQSTSEVPAYYKKMFNSYLEESKGMGLAPLTIALANVGISNLTEAQRENILNYFQNRHNMQAVLKNNRRSNAQEKVNQMQALSDLHGDSQAFREAVGQDDVVALYTDYLRGTQETLEKGKFHAALTQHAKLANFRPSVKKIALRESEETLVAQITACLAKLKAGAATEILLKEVEAFNNATRDRLADRYPGSVIFREFIRCYQEAI